MNTHKQPNMQTCRPATKHKHKTRDMDHFATFNKMETKRLKHTSERCKQLPFNNERLPGFKENQTTC